MTLAPMTFHQKIFSLIAGLVIFVSILELVRRRKLKEEYSWIWLSAGFIIALIVIWYELLGFISRIIGAERGTTTLFLSAIFYLIIVNLFDAVKISKMDEQIKNLVQEISLLKMSGKKMPKIGKKSKK